MKASTVDIIWWEPKSYGRGSNHRWKFTGGVEWLIGNEGRFFHVIESDGRRTILPTQHILAIVTEKDDSSQNSS